MNKSDTKVVINTDSSSHIRVQKLGKRFKNRVLHYGIKKVLFSSSFEVLENRIKELEKLVIKNVLEDRIMYLPRNCKDCYSSNKLELFVKNKVFKKEKYWVKYKISQERLLLKKYFKKIDEEEYEIELEKVWKKKERREKRKGKKKKKEKSLKIKLKPIKIKLRPTKIKRRKKIKRMGRNIISDEERVMKLTIKRKRKEFEKYLENPTKMIYIRDFDILWTIQQEPERKKRKIGIYDMNSNISSVTDDMDMLENDSSIGFI